MNKSQGDIRMIDTKNVGERIAALRKERGLTGEKFAELLGVSPQAVSKWETGRCRFSSEQIDEFKGD
jgi:transcriptional regulator with XRE-family HTH domain